MRTCVRKSRAGRPATGVKPRCQVATCMEERTQLKRENGELRSEIRRMNDTWDSEHEGAKRHFETLLIEAKGREGTLREGMRVLDMCWSS